MFDPKIKAAAGIPESHIEIKFEEKKELKTEEDDRTESRDDSEELASFSRQYIKLEESDEKLLAEVLPIPSYLMPQSINSLDLSKGTFY